MGGVRPAEANGWFRRVAVQATFVNPVFIPLGQGFASFLCGYTAFAAI